MIQPGRSIVAGVALLLLAAAGLAGYAFWRDQPPAAVPEVQCAQLPETIEPSVAWRFQTDPADAGLAARWFDPAFDDSRWDASAPGVAWEEQGYPDYDGLAWYRATFTSPATWGTAYLGIGGVDDDARLWVNGVEMDWAPTSGPASQTIQLPAGQPLQLSLRVVDTGGPGGVKQPVRVGRSPWAVLPPDSYARWLAALHPGWPMPGWARDGYYAWTFTGLPGAESEALMASDSAVAPWPAAPSLGLWLHDPATGSLAPAKPVFSLLDGYLPIPQAKWTAAGLTVQTTLLQAVGEEAIHYQVAVRNDTDQSRAATLLAIVRPLAFNPDWRPTYAAGYDGQGRLWLNGQPFVQVSAPPTRLGVGTLAEVLEAAQTGDVPPARNLVCAPIGDAAAALAFAIRLPPGEDFNLSFSFPSQAGARFPKGEAKKSIEEARNLWKAAIGTPSIVIPDQTIMDAYRASVGYLLLALDPSGPRPGPLEHNKVWVRDAAFIGEALLAAGHGELVRGYLPALFAHQDINGRIPAVIGPGGPEPVDEWDAQGQAIFLVAAIYRYSGDLSFLQRWEPNVRMAAAFLRALRARTQGDPPATRGLLPSSRSAEDLGPADWHHYWDNFWAVAGLEEAALIESRIGRLDDAAWMRAEAEALRQSIRASVEAVMGPSPAYIPSAPEGLTGPAMARGTSVSLYPVEVLPRDDPLIVRSFATYYEKWIEPDNGGYRHIWGQWWPYGGLGLARDYLRLGRQDVVHQILAWTLNHQTLPGTYAWAEQVAPTHGGITGGDMPHAWASATHVTLVREMLAMRRGDMLELFAGVPASWLEAATPVGLRDAPTEFGALTALIESELDTSGPSWEGTLTLTINGGARPAGGFAWKLPRSPARMEGPPGAEIRDGRLFVPALGGRVKLWYVATHLAQ